MFYEIHWAGYINGKNSFAIPYFFNLAIMAILYDNPQLTAEKKEIEGNLICIIK